ncbi:MAG TPA: hypothetical protein VJN69_06300 [Candidatus Acidoferrales bacterium]|nr:hypothetical protein [Candidatus Acidoferrales bacterium]
MSEKSTQSEDFLELLKKIRPPQAPAKTPDPKTSQEEIDLDNQRKKTIISGLQQDIDERKEYAGRAFWLVVVWLVVIGIILFLEGFRWHSFDLTSGVLQVLIGSTTGSIVGIFLILTHYLFPRR